MKHKLPLAPALCLLAAAALLLALPRVLSEQSIAHALGGVAVERMDALPAEQTPVPVSEEERTGQALAWLNRAGESAEFLMRREDIPPAAEELTETQSWERLGEQWGALAPWGLSLPATPRTAVYFCMVHGVTQEHQGYYTLTAGEDGAAVSCTVSAATGALLACAYATPPLPQPVLAEAFAKLWGIDNGAVLKHFSYSSLGWEHCVYANGGEHYIYIDSRGTPGCTVSLKPGTGERG